MASKETPLIYLVAGESSGDLLGARLMESLLVLYPGARFMGVGGARMEAQGLQSLFPMAELSLMGLAEILPHARRLLGRIREVAHHIEVQKPDVLVTIDSPGFNLRLAKKVRRLAGRPAMIHYTAPSVWAWRPGRAKKMAPLFDHLMTLFPFEPPYFTHVGLEATFVGHPLSEDPRLISPAFHFRAKRGIGENIPLVLLLAGSRQGEVTRHGPLFMESVRLLQEKIPDVEIVCPTLASFEDQLRALAPAHIRLHFVRDEDEKYAAMWASNAALAASGTVTLELALAKTPMVVAYRVNGFSAFLMRRLIKTPYVCLVNILEGKELVPERLQEGATSARLSQDLLDLLGDKGTQQRVDFQNVRNHLLPENHSSPSGAAAAIVARYC